MRVMLAGVLMLISVTVVSGCGKMDAGVAVRSQSSGIRADEVVATYDRAVVSTEGLSVYQAENEISKVGVSVSSGWIGEGPMWKPVDNSKSFVRVAVFSSGTAIDAWTEQQSDDVHQVLGAREDEGGYLLIVHHPTLKSTLVKRFVSIPGSAFGYVFGECRIADEDQDVDSIWATCKTMLQSIRMESGESEPVH